MIRNVDKHLDWESNYNNETYHCDEAWDNREILLLIIEVETIIDLSKGDHFKPILYLSCKVCTSKHLN